MNWSRGLLRLWLAISILWVVFLGGLFYVLSPPVPPPEAYVSEPLSKELEEKFLGEWRSKKSVRLTAEEEAQFMRSQPPELIPGTQAYNYRMFWRASILIAGMWAIAVPAGLFIVGWVGLWIGRGFRSPKAL